MNNRKKYIQHLSNKERQIVLDRLLDFLEGIDYIRFREQDEEEPDSDWGYIWETSGDLLHE